jgi:hypothetical protein
MKEFASPQPNTGVALAAKTTQDVVREKLARLLAMCFPCLTPTSCCRDQPIVANPKLWLNASKHLVLRGFCAKVSSPKCFEAYGLS